MKKNSVKVLSALVAGLLAQVAYAGSITDIKVSVLPNKQRVIKFKFNKGAVEPTGFITSSPARITLDFANTDLKVKQPTLTFNDSLLNQIVTAEGEGSTRVLLGLGQEGQYNVQVKGNEVWVQLSEASSSNSAPVSATPVARTAQAQGAYSATPFNIDFHKGGNNSGVVEFASNFTGEPQVRSQSDRLVITLKNYPLPTQAQRNLDVTDFSTPVRTISVRRVGNDTQITLRNQGTWKHTITGKNGRQSIQITPTKNVTSLGVGAGKTKQKFTGKRISLDFQNVDVRTVLQILATESGMNIVASDSVQGKMTLSLKDVPWDQALDLILDARELDMRRVGNIINVAPRAEMLARDKAELTARKELDDLGPLFSQSFQLKYKNVEEFKKILRITDGSSSGTSNNSILTARGSALIDPATNTLIINDVQSVIQKFNALIEELDVPARQVMVEARIVEASDTLSRELGVKFGAGRNGSTSWGNNWNNGIERNSRYARSGSSGSNGIPFAPNVNLPVASAVGSIAVVRSFSSGVLGLELTAAETEGRSKTISTPRVLTQDRQEAEIKQGYQVPYTTRDSDGSTTTSFKDAVMSLKVLPRITPDNKIIMDVTINKDTPDNTYQSSEGEPSIRTQSVKTQAMIEDGGTLVVGGVYQEVIQNNLKKVPVLGDLPVLGNLFKSRSRNNSRNELLFFITPRIMGSETSVMRY